MIITPIHNWVKYFFKVECNSFLPRITQKHGKKITKRETDEVKAIFTHRRPVPQSEINSVKRGYVGWSYGSE
jgi:hypothetical protein